jgi:hypothetical protein
LLDAIGFRGITYYTSSGKNTVVTRANLAEALYNSSMYSPYKYELLSDTSEVERALTQGYSQDRLEKTMGYSYNLYASIMAIYIMQGINAN